MGFGAKPQARSQGRQPPITSPARMPGLYAKRLCTMQSPPSIHNPSPRGRQARLPEGERPKRIRKMRHRAFTKRQGRLKVSAQSVARRHANKALTKRQGRLIMNAPRLCTDAKPTKRSQFDRSKQKHFRRADLRLSENLIIITS